MAAMHSPARVTFLFVDYKGGSAFADCVDLPTRVGLVTDLSPHLVRRALTSLNAELRHREHLLNAQEGQGPPRARERSDPDTPAESRHRRRRVRSARARRCPSSSTASSNVAQRGRSLGLHLILATQRPAGVIKDNLRANTNLRVALRMADEADSTDVVGYRAGGRVRPGAARPGASRRPGPVGSRRSSPPTSAGAHRTSRRSRPDRS